MEKICIECSEPFRGRMDKKFCCDQCRNNYNNKRNSYTSSYTRKVNRILQKNRKILAAFVPEGKANVNEDNLKKQGFDFNYLTNIYTTKTGKSYHFCYEYGYLELGNGWLTVVRKMEYVN